jgi:hypothetical protein
MVERSPEYHVGHSSTPPCPTDPPVYGCIKRGMGWPHGGRKSSSIWNFLTRPGETSHKSEGIARDSLHASAVCTPCRRPGCTGQHRQQNCRGLHQQAGRQEEHHDASPHQATLSVAGQAQHLLDSHSYHRGTQRNSGSIVKTQPNNTRGMDTPPPGIPAGMQTVGNPTNRSIRHEVDQSTSAIYLSPTRPDGDRSGCIISGVADDVRLCIPANEDSTQSSQEIEARVLSPATHSPQLGELGLVPGTPRDAHSTTEAVTLPPAPAQAAPTGNLPSEPGRAESAYVAALQSGTRGRGLSAVAAKRAAMANRESTIRHYSFLWSKFLDWCVPRQRDPLGADRALIADFLIYLRTQKKYRPATVNNYLTAVSNVIRRQGSFIPSLDPDLKDLIKSFWKESPRKARKPPAWNLAFVLDALRRPPFTPLGTAKYKFLTWKVAFLVAFATANRRSELHAMLYENLLHPAEQDWSSVTIQLDPLFIAKNQPASGVPADDFIHIPGLASHIGHDMPEDLKLCPCEALRTYILRTDHYRNASQKKLFISYYPAVEKDIASPTISRWLKHTVLYIYKNSPTRLKERFNISAEDVDSVTGHDVRKYGASWAMDRHIPLNMILSACGWRAQTTFTSFYLQKMFNSRTQMHHLGPVVAAKQLCQPPQGQHRHRR